MMTTPHRRKRVKHSKVRTGCFTCRDRRVKCGEEKPQCERCRASGRFCAGYESTAASFSDKTYMTLLPKGLSEQKRAIHGPSLCSFASYSSRVTYALDYFRLRTVQDLPGSKWLLAWDKLVLPLCQTEPAIVHAAAAIASLHLTLQSRSRDAESKPDQDYLHFAFLQYNQAISAITLDMKPSQRDCNGNTAEVVLVVSLLLFAFDLLQGYDARAALHFQHGRKILLEQLHPTTTSASNTEEQSERREVSLRTEPRAVMDLLIQIFVRLDADICMLSGEPSYLYPVCDQPIPTSFSSLTEAMVQLDTINRDLEDTWCQMYTLAEKEIFESHVNAECLPASSLEILVVTKLRVVPLDANPEILQRTQQIKKRLFHWTEAFESLPAGIEESHSRILVEVRFFQLWFAISTWRDHDEMPTDRFLDRFKHALDLIESYFNQNQSSTPGSPPQSDVVSLENRPTFAFGTGLITTLRLIVHRCRDSFVRRRGIDLIRAMKIRGAHDTDSLASCCETIVDVEETRAREILHPLERSHFACAELLPVARILECGVADAPLGTTCSPKRSGQLIYTVMGADGDVQLCSKQFIVSRYNSKDLAA